MLAEGPTHNMTALQLYVATPQVVSKAVQLCELSKKKFFGTYLDNLSCHTGLEYEIACNQQILSATGETSKGGETIVTGAMNKKEEENPVVKGKASMKEEGNTMEKGKAGKEKEIRKRLTCCGLNTRYKVLYQPKYRTTDEFITTLSPDNPRNRFPN